MIEYGMNAMVVATMALSVTAATMAWCMALAAVRQRAEKEETLQKERDLSIE